MIKRVALIFFFLAIPVFIQHAIYALSTYLFQFNAQYGTSGSTLDTCCHRTQEGGSRLNPYGKAFKESRYNLAAIESKDSDGDGFKNIAEINARTFPGDPKSTIK